MKFLCKCMVKESFNSINCDLKKMNFTDVPFEFWKFNLLFEDWGISFVKGNRYRVFIFLFSIFFSRILDFRVMVSKNYAYINRLHRKCKTVILKYLFPSKNWWIRRIFFYKLFIKFLMSYCSIIGLILL